jgi:proline iminopeptidase
MMTEVRFARAWANWENALASVESNGWTGEAPGEYARAFARLENHYFYNDGFLTAETQILNRMDRIAHIPGFIVQGRFDMICPPKAAYQLHKNWPASRLTMVPMAGHALSEPGISRELVRIMDNYGSGQR